MSGDDPRGWSALAELYHRYLTGLLLGMVTRIGTAEAAEVVFRTFRAQHLAAFLPGLAKLGLENDPPAVACAKYHVLSNALGGVRVEWLPESDTKSWVRYLPPRWIFDGPAICGIPSALSRSMLRGWHGHNGVSLGNDRLGFVCTMQTTDGQPGLEGYYIEESRPLAEDNRVRFRPEERPTVGPVELELPSWEPVRLAKVERNYATNYIHTILPVMSKVLGPADAGAVGHIVGRQIGMQTHQTIMALLDAPNDPFAVRFARLLDAHGSPTTVTSDGDGAWTVTLDRWRIFDDQPAHPSTFDSWNALWEGMAAMEQQRLTVVQRLDLADPVFEWRIS